MKPAKMEWAKDWLKTTKKMYMNGEWTAGMGDVYESISPMDKTVIGRFNVSSQADVDHAVHAARLAFENSSWKNMPPKERAKKMRQIANVLEAHQDELSTIETLDNGKLYRESWWDVQDVIELFEYYAGWTDKLYGDVNPVSGNFLSYTRYEPIGVCGQIIPWNFPLDMAGYKLAPALAMGNTLLIKPSEVTSLSLIRLVEVIDEAEILPKGVLNLVLGDGSVGHLISRHKGVDKMAFTGSTEVGRKLIQASADSNLKPLSLELGGKSPNLIFADAPDLAFAISRSFEAMFSGKGEKCSEPTRLLVERPIYETVLTGLLEAFKKWRVGDPFDPNNHQGPQISQQHFDKIMHYIEIGKQEGAKLLCGGAPNTVGENSTGFYIDPTIFYDCTHEMRISQEEIFGPVLVVIPFDTEEEAIQLANDTDYGLAAGFWTNDTARVQRVANALQAGMIFVNQYGCYDHASPFGGYKQSGWGQELAHTSLRLYTKSKAIWLAY